MNYVAIARAIAQRAEEIGRDWAEIARRSTDEKGRGMDTSTLWHAHSYGQEGKKARAVSAATLRRINRGLDWPEGTLEGIGNGAPYPEPEPTPPERVEALERRVDDLSDQVASLNDKFEQLVHTFGQGR